MANYQEAVCWKDAARNYICLQITHRTKHVFRRKNDFRRLNGFRGEGGKTLGCTSWDSFFYFSLRIPQLWDGYDNNILFMWKRWLKGWLTKLVDVDFMWYISTLRPRLCTCLCCRDGRHGTCRLIWELMSTRTSTGTDRIVSVTTAVWDCGHVANECALFSIENWRSTIDPHTTVFDLASMIYRLSYQHCFCWRVRSSSLARQRINASIKDALIKFFIEQNSVCFPSWICYLKSEIKIP